MVQGTNRCKKKNLKNNFNEQNLIITTWQNTKLRRLTKKFHTCIRAHFSQNLSSLGWQLHVRWLLVVDLALDEFLGYTKAGHKNAQSVSASSTWHIVEDDRTWRRKEYMAYVVRYIPCSAIGSLMVEYSPSVGETEVSSYNKFQFFIDKNEFRMFAVYPLYHI